MVIDFFKGIYIYKIRYDKWKTWLREQSADK